MTESLPWIISIISKSFNASATLPGIYVFVHEGEFVFGKIQHSCFIYYVFVQCRGLSLSVNRETCVWHQNQTLGWQEALFICQQGLFNELSCVLLLFITEQLAACVTMLRGSRLDTSPSLEDVWMFKTLDVRCLCESILCHLGIIIASWLSLIGATPPCLLLCGIAVYCVIVAFHVVPWRREIYSKNSHQPIRVTFCLFVHKPMQINLALFM